MTSARVLLLSAAMLAAPALAASIEAAPGTRAAAASAQRGEGGAEGSACVFRAGAALVRANGSAARSGSRGPLDPACRYKCTFCGPIKTCAPVCR
ncbi:MAG TPA: hypothetical protein VNK52_02580 [Hyphomicrobiaceae bacterium]|nr:hypothetical protein [Hyphomicrobiaceae bacterium]